MQSCVFVNSFNSLQNKLQSLLPFLDRQSLFPLPRVLKHHRLFQMMELIKHVSCE